MVRKITPEQVEKALLDSKNGFIYKVLTEQNFMTYTEALEYLTEIVNQLVK